MRLKDPFSLKAADMTKRTNKPRKPRDEESSDEVSGKGTVYVILFSEVDSIWNFFSPINLKSTCALSVF